MISKELYVKELKRSIIYEFTKQKRNGVYGYSQKHLAYNSNKIEGSTLTKKYTASLFETGTIIADGEIVKAKDVEEMTGHFAMFNEMLKTYEKPLSHELIKKYHFRLKSGVFEDLANGFPVGEYKTRMNYVSNLTTALPDEVFEKMSELMDWYNQLLNVDIEDIAKFHARFENIHPFQDGNGRIGRIIIFKECLKNNLVPLIIDDDNKALYYNCLSSADDGNYSKLIDLFVNEQNIFYQNTLNMVIDHYLLDKDQN